MHYMMSMATASLLAIRDSFKIKISSSSSTVNKSRLVIATVLQNYTG